MTQPNQTAREAQLDQDRESLNSTLDELQGRMSVDHLAREALGLLRENVGPYTHSVDRAIRANPMALALTGAGLAWLIFGGRTGDKHESGQGGQHPNGSRSFPYGIAGDTPDYTSRGYAGGIKSDDDGWSRRVDTLRRRASGMLAGLERGAKDYASESGRILSEFTADMRGAFRHGLDDLSDAARERVTQAREAAYAARLRVERGAREGGRQTVQLVDDHPMVAGVIAMAVGAAFAAALPRTRIEDRSFGAESDRLMDAAADRLREERARMSRVAEGVADEVKSAAKDAADAVAEGVDELGSNMRDRAERESENAGSGDEAKKVKTKT